VKRQLLTLVGGTLGLWLLLALPAGLTWGASALRLSGVAAALCLAPAAATLAWAVWARGRSPEHLLAVAVGGMGLRVAVVVGVGLTIFLLLPGFRTAGFWGWVLVFYLSTLALEMSLVLRGGPADPNPLMHR
jgi:hypothetical protein